MRKIVFLTSILLFLNISVAFDASLVTENGQNLNLSVEEEENTSSFYTGFPSGFEAPDGVGGLSFRDRSFVNKDLNINLSGNNSALQGRQMQLYYASESKNITQPILAEPVTIPEFTGSYVILDSQISTFKALYPGELYLGLVERTYNVSTGNETETVTEKSVNLTKIENRMRGNYSVVPSIQTVGGTTKLRVDEIVDGANNSILEGRDSKQDLIISVKRGEKILEEKKASKGENEVFNFSFSGGEKVYVNGILSLKTKSIGRCETIDDNEFYYLLNESQFNSDGRNSSCMTVEDTENTILDFANRTVDGDDNSSVSREKCAVTVENASGVVLKNPRVQEFYRGICIRDSNDTLIAGTSAKENTQGIYLNDSSSRISGISLKNEDSEIKAVANSRVNLSDVNFDTANFTGEARDISMENVYSPPPDPENLQNISQWLNITANGDSSRISFTGFNFGSISNLAINPKYIYKADRNGDNESWNYERLSAVKEPVNGIIYSDENLTDFSVFAVYGENITGEAGDGPAEGTGTQGEGDTQGGGLTPQPEPEPEPEPTAIDLNLSLDQEYIQIEQGETEELGFSITNVGEVVANDVYVESEVNPGWQSGRQDFSAITPGSQVEGSILMNVFQSEILGNYTFPVEAISSEGATLDTEYITVEVIPRSMSRDLNIVESPTFLNLEADTRTSVGFLIDNTGDYDLENITASARNADNCIKSIEGSYNLQKDARENLEYTVKTERGESTCTGAIVFSSEGEETLGFTPVRIEIKEKSLAEKLTTNIMPILTLVWTIFTIIWLRRRLYE